MPIYRYKNKFVFHIHVPKTGGTAIFDACLAKNCSVEMFSKQPDPIHKITPQHFHYNIWKDMVMEPIPKIVGWRDPWHRTVSEFVWQTRTIDFDKLNQWLKTRMSIVQQDPSWGDNHYRPQTEFFIKNETVHIMPYKKNMEPAKTLIKKFLGIDIEFKTTPQKRYDYTLPSIDDVLQLDVKRTWEKVYHKDLEFNA